jgi:hypothetical protein
MLTKGERWKILGVLVILLVAYLLLATVLNAIGLSSMDPQQPADPNLSLALILGSLIPSTLFNLAWGTIQPSMYVELRNLKEGGSAGNLHEVFA